MPRAQVPLSLCFATENAKYTVDMSTGGTAHVKNFRMPSLIEIGKYEPYRFAARRRTTSNNEADIMIAIGISPMRA